VASVGLFYVGAVLFINGVMLLGRVEPRAGAIMNLFVGGLQVVIPTFLIFTANGDQDTILLASGLYLFGFTYLYVGIGLLAGLDSTGVGWFSLFVAIAALAYSFMNFTRLADAPFGVIWLYWSFLWSLFFVLLGLKQEWLTRYTGWVALIEGWVTAAIPGFLLFSGYWSTSSTTATVLAVIGVAMVLILLPTARRDRRERGAHAQPAPTPEPTAPAPDRPVSTR
jgi:putative amide transporter protein